MDKICTACKKLKPIKEFSKHKGYKGGFRNKCKKCSNEYSRNWWKKYGFTRKEASKQYRENNKEKIRELKQKYYFKNKKEILKRHTERCRNRNNKDIKYKITVNTRNRIAKVLKGKTKSLSTMFLIGCETDYLMYHIQTQFNPGMNWDNYGTGHNGKGMKEWHIDHIRPCASFDLTDPEEQRKCFHYTNLQPLWAKENLTKDKGDKHGRRI